jgi:16S rRNA (uracil1498-N3)-methyltransferase
LREEKKAPKRRRRRRPNLPEMRRIVLDRVVENNRDVTIEGPLLEALLLHGGRKGSIVTLTDARGRDFRGRVLRISDTEASILVFECFPLPTESPVEIVLLQALPERERMEMIIQKTTELGISAIVPFKSERSISLAEREAKQRKSHRWQEIAVKATRQSRRARVPSVETYRSFEEALVFCRGGGVRIVLWENGGSPLKEALAGVRPERVYGMVGPEGGLTGGEIEKAKASGFVPVKLGQRILRTETAAIILVAILQYELGDLQ